MDFLSTLFSYGTVALIIIGILFALCLPLVVSFIFRRVVPTNAVHIVQSSKHTKAYGREMEPDSTNGMEGEKLETHGNTYYEWPSFLPFFGVKTTELPLSVFDLYLQEYAAYDSGRLPFSLDVMAFFRISNPTLAAQRVSDFEELNSQMKSILQGAIRTILASVDIEKIMSDRAVFGEKFTTEVDSQLKAWGVTTVKSIELMDIRDANGSKVIYNIMAKKQSHIEMESRVELAKNKQTADIAEIAAKRDTEMEAQVATETIGKKEAEVAQAVGIARERSNQQVQIELKTTTEKRMEVQKVNDVRTAEIRRDVAAVQAEEKKVVLVKAAEATKDAQVFEAEGQLVIATNEARAVQLHGEAKASAEKLMLMAPVDAQVTLAKELGKETDFQNFQVRLKEVDANREVGIAAAQALTKADSKIIVTAGSASEGMSTLGSVFSPKGGVNIAGMIEGFMQTDAGKKIVEKFVGETIDK